MSTIKVELQPFTVPNYVLVGSKSGLHQDGAWFDGLKYHISELSSETLSELCDEFRDAVFAKAARGPL